MYICKMRFGCGLMQKWNKIQPFFWKLATNNCCGLMQKWNKIQRWATGPGAYRSCGLMQKWNKIQHGVKFKK